MPERRYVDQRLAVETRAEADGGGVELVGHAAVFDQWTTLYSGKYWEWREIVRPKAFKRAIKEKQDVRALLNHDPNFVIARTKAGSLKLSEDETGLLAVIVPPDTQTIRDLVVEPIRRGDIDQMSFAFLPRTSDEETIKEKKDVTIIDRGGERITIRYEGEKRIEEREVLDADLYDVSPVTYPAYVGTDIGVRSSEWSAELRARIEAEDKPFRRSAPKREHYLRVFSGEDR